MLDMLYDKAAFLELAGGDQTVAKEVVDLFRQEWPKLMDKVLQAIVNNDAKTLEYAAHRLKGNLRNFYAEKMVLLAEQLEDSGHAGQCHGLEQMAKELEALLKRLDQQLTEL